MSSDQKKTIEPWFLGYLTCCLVLSIFVGYPLGTWGNTALQEYLATKRMNARWERRITEANQALEEARIEARTEEARAKGKAWVKAQETLAEADAIVARARAHKEAAVTLEPYLSRTFLLYRQVEQGCGVELTPQAVVKGE